MPPTDLELVGAACVCQSKVVGRVIGSFDRAQIALVRTEIVPNYGVAGGFPAAVWSSLVPTLRQLEYLVAVADTLHFRRAAERVNTTQPTLSEQIKVLEQRLGVALIERTRSSVVVTQAGREIVEIARRMLRDAQHIRDITGSLGPGLSGVIRMGLPSTIGPYLLPRIVPVLHQAFPSLRLYVREELPYALPRGLEDGMHDVVIVPHALDDPALHRQLLFVEPLFLAVPLDHKLAEREQLKKSDLAGLDLLALGPGHQLRDAVVAIAKQVGAAMRYDYEGTSLDTLREMMAMGLGVTFLPGLYVRGVLANDPRFKTYAVEGLHASRAISMCWRRTTARRESFERLADVFLEVLNAESETSVKV
jgi:LysR family transcriptional regulator, hydrogen peroxide-inducible genes activator